MEKKSILFNTSNPMIMHIDLNSCFAIIEQQANKLLRGRPVGVAAYDTPKGFVLAASYEAKAKGIALGVNNQQARNMCPDIVILTPDPAKYREAHRRFKEAMLEYTPDVVAKSIDEFVLDMHASPALRKRVNAGMGHNEAMLDIGRDMKQKIHESLGEWVTVNIGISTNRFLAKYAAGFGKPDGMLLIDHTSIEKWLRCGVFHDCGKHRDDCKPMNLVDLPGINVRYRARLRTAEIYSPSDFLDASLQTLKKQVFKSINGLHWYNRLRGYEADSYETQQKSIGHQYALPEKTMDLEKLERLLMKLCEKTGRRLRKHEFCATGIHLYLGFDRYRDGYSSDDAYVKKEWSSTSSNANEAAGFNLQKFSSWHHGEKVYHRLYSTLDIYEAAKKLLYQAEIPNNVKVISVHVFGLEPWHPEQLSLFAMPNNVKGQQVDFTSRSIDAKKRLSDSVDSVNNRYGEFVITPGTMIDMSGTILDRIAFGQVRDV